MIFLKKCCPLTVLIYTLSITLPVMISPSLPLAVIAFVSGLVTSIVSGAVRNHGFYVFLFVFLSITNPLFSHNGSTVLFVVMDTPFTLEAFAYGIGSALSVVAVIYWFALFSHVMTSDRLFWLLGLLSNKLALIFSMALRFIPLFIRRAREIEAAGTAMGICRHDSITEKIRTKLHVFSVMVTWTLEDGIHTADSMEARGYGICRRTRYTSVIFTLADAALILASLLLSGFAIARGTGFEYYPVISTGTTAATPFAYAAYITLSALPIIIDIGERVKWKYLKSAI